MASWNWPALFFSTAWFCYRRMHGYAWTNFFLPLPPSTSTAIAAALMAAFAFAFSSFIAVAPAAYSDYHPRMRVVEGLRAAGAFRKQVDEFYGKHRRLPTPDEAVQFRDHGPAQNAHSVVYDAGKRMILVTFREGFAGKRVARHAEDQNGALSWTCRTVDVERRYLPSSYRG
ncbi:MAG: pilin [Betaproteobacteria bacterium]|nr:pilin [Betaproteobacteria bacterium]